MLTIEPGREHMGATVRGADLSNPLTARDFGVVLEAIGRHGLLRFPDQNLDPVQQKAFAVQFGRVPPIRGRLAPFTAPGVPEVNILSNILDENGKNIGAVDAGVIWHTDMVHNETPGFANVLYARMVPRRGDQVLGGTQFINLGAAYDGLSADVKARIKDAKGIVSGESYMSLERKPAGDYGVNTHKGAAKPPIAHPLVLNHPISGRKILYCDLGHIDRIEGVAGDDGSLLIFLLEHLLQPQFRFLYQWTVGDVVIWDNLSSLHQAVFDYGPDEHRLMWRCQIEGEKVFNPAFVKTALADAKAVA